MTSQEALSDWRWLEHELLPAIDANGGLDGDPDAVTNFVLVKVESLVAVAQDALLKAAAAEDAESLPYK